MISLHEGRPEGVVVDLAYAVAEKAGLSVKIEAMDWPEAQQLVAAGKADALLQINPDPERQAIFDFSDILLDSNFHIFRRIDRGDIHGLNSLQGKKVGVEAGGFPREYLEQHDEIQAIVVPSWEAAFQMLHQGQLDAVFVDRWVGEYQLYLHQFGDIARVDPPVVTDHSRIAVKKGNAKLLERINFGLREIAQDGTRQAIVNRWQGKGIVYLTRESFDRWVFGGILAIAVLLFALVYARVLKQRNISLQQKVEAQERLRLFIEHAPTALAMFDRDMRYIAVSHRWLSDYSLGKRDLRGMSHYDIFPEIGEAWKEAHRRGMAGEVLRAEGDRFQRADGSVQWVRWEIRPWRNATGEVGGIVIFTEDITERKRAEQALLRSEKLASVGRMAATIAHEINNPLAAVTNAIYLAMTVENLPPSARQFLDTADEELKRVAHITRQSLGFYRESTAAVPTSVAAVLESAIEVLKSRIKAKHALIEKQWDGNVQVTAVAGELRQVFTNVLSNSLEAIGENGTIKFRVSTGTGVNANHYVRITVADNGKGIDRDMRQHLFEPFFTSKASTGTGLGLWVSKQIIDKHGGMIRVHSSTNGSRRGTAVSVVLPVGTALVKSQPAGA
jgi:PAS domain S-box-containing protein